jgi:hypothetical protein
MAGDPISRVTIGKKESGKAGLRHATSRAEIAHREGENYLKRLRNEGTRSDIWEQRRHE